MKLMGTVELFVIGAVVATGANCGGGSTPNGPTSTSTATSSSPADSLSRKPAAPPCRATAARSASLCIVRTTSLLSMPSARALIILLPIERSLAQNATKPQRTRARSRPSLSFAKPRDRYGLGGCHVVPGLEVRALWEAEHPLQLDERGV